MSICECKSDNMKGKEGEGEGELCVFRALLSIIFAWKLSQKIIYSKTFTSKDNKKKHLFLFEVQKVGNSFKGFSLRKRESSIVQLS